MYLYRAVFNCLLSGDFPVSVTNICISQQTTVLFTSNMREQSSTVQYSTVYCIQYISSWSVTRLNQLLQSIMSRPLCLVIKKRGWWEAIFGVPIFSMTAKGNTLGINPPTLPTPTTHQIDLRGNVLTL